MRNSTPQTASVLASVHLSLAATLETDRGSSRRTTGRGQCGVTG
jgi:hypothetical protein